MRKLASVAFLLLLSAPVAAAQLLGSPSNGVVINLQYARNFGCSDDPPPFFITNEGPDFQVRVWSKGSVIHTSAHRQDMVKPEWRDYVELPDLPRPATLSFEVREAEPAPEDAVWFPCDIQVGAGDWLNVTVGATSVDINSRGDSENAAQLVAKVGPIGARRPLAGVPELVEANSSSIAISWRTGSSEIVTTQHVASFWAGDRDVPPGTSVATWEGLEPNWPYDFRILREGEDWSVLGPRVSFRTSAAPPGVLMLNATTGIEEVNVSWTVANAEEVAIYVGRTAEFIPSASTLRHTGADSGHATLSGLPSNIDLYARAIARGGGGTSAASPSVHFVLQERPSPPPPTATLTQEHGGVRIAWGAPTTAGISHHEVRIGGRIERVEMPTDSTLVTGLEIGEFYDVTVRAVNTNGLFADAPLRVMFDPPNEAPSVKANVSPSHARLGELVILYIAVADADHDAVNVQVGWGDGSTADATGRPALTHRYGIVGNRNITVTAVDALGKGSISMAMVTVTSAPPAPKETPVEIPGAGALIVLVACVLGLVLRRR